MSKPNKWVATDVMYVDKTCPDFPNYKEQLTTRGFSDTELWNLDVTFAEFMLPRFKRFRLLIVDYPSGLSFTKWKTTLAKIIRALELVVSQHKGSSQQTKKECKLKEEGLQLLAKHFTDFWW